MRRCRASTAAGEAAGGLFGAGRLGGSAPGGYDIFGAIARSEKPLPSAMATARSMGRNQNGAGARDLERFSEACLAA